MSRVIDSDGTRGHGPVFVSKSYRRIELRIGEPGSGSRKTSITPSEARLLAYTLLVEAERQDSSKPPSSN